MPGRSVRADFRTQIKPGSVVSKLAALRPTNAFRYSLRFLTLFPEWTAGDSCFGNRIGISFGDLFLYYNDQLLKFLDGKAEYEILLFGFNTRDHVTDELAGFADDNRHTRPDTIQGWGILTTVTTMSLYRLRSNRCYLLRLGRRRARYADVVHGQ